MASASDRGGRVAAAAVSAAAAVARGDAVLSQWAAEAVSAVEASRVTLDEEASRHARAVAEVASPSSLTGETI